MTIKRKSEQSDLPVPKFFITEAFKIIKQIPLETSMNIYKQILCQNEKLLHFKQVLQAFDASSFGFVPIEDILYIAPKCYMLFGYR